MKINTPLPLTLFLLVLVSCSRSVKKENQAIVLTQDCYADRAVEEQVTNTLGITLKWQDIWLLESEDKNYRWQPCDLPSQLQKDGLKVVFSGEIMRIFPGERRVATPIQLKLINLSENK